MARAAEPAHAAELHAAWHSWRSVLDALVDIVGVEEEARAALESRSFAGRPVLLADAAQEWASLRDQVDRLASLAELLPPVLRAKASRRRRTTSGGRGRLADGAQARARTLADDARVSAFEQLGDRRRALAILERRLCEAAPTR